MNDPSTMKIRQTIQHTLGHLPKDLLARPTTEPLDFLVNAVQGAPFAELHCNGDGGGGRIHEGAIVAANVL